MNKLTTTLLILLTLNIIQANDDEISYKCNTDLVRAYGLTGRKIANSAHMEMCPSIRNSCCQKRDQLMIYNNWINLKEDDFIKNRFANNHSTYLDFLNNLSIVDQLAKKLIKKLKHKRISNCKQLAKRITRFEIASIVPQILKNITRMKDFLQTSYKGFYCAICDIKNHRMIDTENKSITYCYGFCRQLIEMSLPFLIFFHSDIIKYINLISKFLVSCDFKGDYDSVALIPKRLIFFADKEEQSKLKQCRDHRNDKQWMTYCSDVCENFWITRINPYFEPKIHIIRDYNDWVAKEIEERKIQHLRHPLFLEKGTGGSKSSQVQKIRDVTLFNVSDSESQGDRLLSSRRPQTKEDYELIAPHIFKSKISYKIPLGSFSTQFSQDGMCLYESGINSIFSDDRYNEVKMMMHLMNMKKPWGFFHKVKNFFGIDELTAKERKEIESLPSSSFLGMKSETILETTLFLIIALNFLRW